MLNINKGMFLETQINNFCNQLNPKEGYFFKVPLNFKFINKNGSIIKGKLLENKNTDYIGIVKGVYIEFEAKETYKEFFNTSNIKKEQWEKLKLINSLGGVSFFVIYFHEYDKYFILNFSSLKSKEYKSSIKIPYEWFLENATEVYSDGIKINLMDEISHLISCV